MNTNLIIVLIFALAVLLFAALVMIIFYGTIIALPIILIKKSNKEKKDETVALQIDPSVADETTYCPVEGTVLDKQVDSTL